MGTTLTGPITALVPVDISGGDMAAPHGLPRYIYVGTAGNLTVTINGVDRTISNAANGYHGLRASTIKQTGTTAANMHWCY